VNSLPENRFEEKTVRPAKRHRTTIANPPTWAVGMQSHHLSSFSHPKLAAEARAEAIIAASLSMRYRRAPVVPEVATTAAHDSGSGADRTSRAIMSRS
jgi:hypothetical protein